MGLKAFTPQEDVLHQDSPSDFYLPNVDVGPAFSESLHFLSVLMGLLYSLNLGLLFSYILEGSNDGCSVV